VSETDWVPLSQRDERPQDESLLEGGTPEHLAAPLMAWTADYLSLPRGRATGFLAQRVAARLRIPLYTSDPTWLVRSAREDDRLLDVVDAALYLDDALRWQIEVVGAVPTPYAGEADWLPDADWPENSNLAQAVDRLDMLLTDAGSAYRVDWQHRGLTRRVDATVAAAARQAIASVAEPGTHLQAAWHAVYGRHPDPTKAYDEAVRAVEAAAIPVVLPKGSLETLGKVRAHLQAAAAQWEIAIEGKQSGAIDPLVSMILLLWEGQQRHAGGPASRPQRQDEAEMAVHLAATLVQWFTSGAVRRRTTNNP
jgi:hypothetical protein